MNLEKINKFINIYKKANESSIKKGTFEIIDIIERDGFVTYCVKFDDLFDNSVRNLHFTKDKND